MSSVIKKCYEDGFAEINGRKYHFCEITHKERLKVFGFAQSIGDDLSSGSLAFMASEKYSDIEDLMFSHMTYDNERLSDVAKKGHFEKYGEDYIILATNSIRVFCHPFMKGTS